MAEIVDITGFKKRKLAKVEAEWDQCMTRAEQLQKDGKHKFAEEMLAKAKVLRKELDKLRGPEVKRPGTYLLKPVQRPNVSFTFNGMAGVDYGYPKPPEKG